MTEFGAAMALEVGSLDGGSSVAQGGRVEDLAPAFVPGRAGGLIAASRSITGAHLVNGGDPAVAARAEAERMRELAWRLS